MDSILAFKTNTYSMICTTPTISASIFPFITDKFTTHSNTVITGLGDISDIHRISSLAVETSKYENLKHNVEMSNIMVKTIQNTIYKSLRTRNPKKATLVVANPNNIYLVDTYGALTKADYVCEGYCRFFGYGIFDSYYKPEMSMENGIEMVKMLLNVLKNRFSGKVEKFVCKIIDENGVTDLEINL